jgi:NADH-quinone oxidoreductase subunit K
MHLAYPLVVAALLFSIGVYGVLARRNAILVLMSVELMLNAVNLNLVTFDIWWRDRLHGGQVLTLFTIVIAAAEVGLGLAIVLLVYRNRQMIDVDRLRTLAEETGDGVREDVRDEGEGEAVRDGESPAIVHSEGSTT